MAFASSNPEKIREVSFILRRLGIRVRGRKMDLHEPSSGSSKDIAAAKARNAFRQIRAPVIAEDTAVYFNAVGDFPGIYAARVFKRLGFKGLLAKLEGRPRGATFVTCVAYCDSFKRKPKVFSGTCWGRIARKPERTGKRGMRFPYERIFISSETGKLLCRMTSAEKAKVSHRAKALKKFAAWFKPRQ